MQQVNDFSFRHNGVNRKTISILFKQNEKERSDKSKRFLKFISFDHF